MANQQSGRGSDSKQNDDKGGKSSQGGTPEQHAEAGRQSHKNDDSKSGSSGGKSGGSSSGSKSSGGK
ncbi:hypothetical protein K32_23760 [Kaistia sp. 32K]|uniref:hypothetical protein n=1 Tax=Kaistia sp. 32K TaxID=2795690 RepID=UPI00191552E3|nr:hypothetical protein [Kaistia sp. 32K]BCP53759.1 hypothetical protein K32_23760 [Kaistia sp. 32K]